MRTLPLHTKITASPLLAIVLVFVHGAAAACALAYLPAWGPSALVSAAIAVSLVIHLRRDGLRLSDDAVVGVTLKEAAACEFATRGGSSLDAVVDRSTFVSPLLIVINASAEGRRCSVALLPDSAPSDDLRRLRVWLKYRSRPDATDSGSL
jgi:toxin CptA